jgi:uncharacterized OsmC-like protein
LSAAAKPRVNMKLISGYQFKATFPGTQSEGLIMDEPPSLGSLKGPNASRVLAASVANCLSASLLFCLRKARIEVDEMEAEAEPTVEKNEAGYSRVNKIEISIQVKLHEDANSERMKRCLEVFENYCVVTGAIRSGIPVKVNVSRAGD